MKFSTSLAIALFPLISLADPLDDYLAKMKTVIEKDDRCEFAVVSIPKDRSEQQLWPRGAVCIGSLKFNEGTMQEKDGCTAFVLNANTLKMGALKPQLGYNQVLGKNCRQGGFEAVMSDLLFTDFTAGIEKDGKKIPVKWAFTSPLDLPDSQFDQKVIFVSPKSPEFATWYEKERAAYLASLNAPETRTPTATKTNKRKHK